MSNQTLLEKPIEARVADMAALFAASAVERDECGGTPKAQRDALRESGLLAMSIPRSFGGDGLGWRQTLNAVRILASVDSSVAHVFGFHHLMLATVRLFGNEAQWGSWYEQTAQRRWFWGNALNPLDRRTIATRCGNWYEFSGPKSFCSGALDSEMMIASAYDVKGTELLIGTLPSARTGIEISSDWNNMGQRQTDSGTVAFHKVRVEGHELLRDPGPLSTPFACLRPIIAQLVLTNVFLGIAEGAFDDAKHYTLKESRPWHTAGVDTTSDDPLILSQYGEFWVALESARALSDRAADKLDEAWLIGAGLTKAQRGEVALAAACAKVAASETGLNICSRMFDVTGARATHGGLRLDRHWRNIRTHTLHDPLAYKIKELGEWALKSQYPTPSFYS
ncbi:monooxygenase [Robbsia andropogonis]|uniref:Monooxygenase n=1 Tax=Robbsia andropogonis TaxID=28092 RepID=A0A0F5JZL1_9BURK|nr:acyl-CoA dehydrogenase family protein [Robbsia andropogonis]KKB63268.1 monooxygenase [Robbsia andropogonis]MCP1118242.1 acyl-CoA dehydrogenase family protein [Robbsia andropogonis]MCP1127477.1 acyl-CoA dehydrogenase family protein [Robbsia andropogonis]